jgi:hypothetical protein
MADQQMTVVNYLCCRRVRAECIGLTAVAAECVSVRVELEKEMEQVPGGMVRACAINNSLSVCLSADTVGACARNVRPSVRLSARLRACLPACLQARSGHAP